MCQAVTGCYRLSGLLEERANSRWLTRPELRHATSMPLCYAIGLALNSRIKGVSGITYGLHTCSDAHRLLPESALEHLAGKTMRRWI